MFFCERTFIDPFSYYFYNQLAHILKRYSAHERPALIRQAAEEAYDLLVIGGGITGAGIALDAATRGLKTILVEKDDFSSGTSSKSTKLIHGGLRYLKQFEIALVREVGRERAIVHKLAPHLVTSEKMLLPLTKDGSFGKLMTSVGLMVYDILAGVESADQRLMLDTEETLSKEPLLESQEILGGGLYAEYRTDDSRLTIEVIKTSVASGANCLNYVEVKDFEYVDGQINQAICQDKLTGDQFTIKAKKIVSAAGPWVDELRSKDGSLSGKRLHLTKGVHLVFPHDKLPIRQAIYFDVPDGRMIFAIPRGKITYVGTTDTNYDGDKDHILTDRNDAEYLIDAVNNTFEMELKVDDIDSTWAGVRPLIHEDGKSASELSRKDEIFESKTGLISIAGGKLTGYRKMAEKVTDLVMKKLEDEEDKPFVKCKTAKTSLIGGPFESADEVDSYRDDLANRLKAEGIDAYQAWYLTATYGKQSDQIVNTFDDFKSQYETADLALILSELRFTIDNEMVSTALDFFVRRTGRLFFDIDSIRSFQTIVVNYLSNEFSWDDNRVKEETEVLEKYVFEASMIFKQ